MTALPEYRVLDIKLERLAPADLRALQSERLRTMVRYVYDQTPFWRRKFDQAGLAPEDIRGVEDLGRVPFCTKQELQADQAENPPYGSYLAVHPSHLVRYVQTSGTTGRPLRRVFSGRDWRYILDRFQRNPAVGPGDLVMVLGPVDGLMGPTAGSESFTRAGAMVIHAGLYSTETKIRLIQDIRPTAISGTASYLLHMIDAARAMEVDLAKLGIRAVVSVGEPGAALPATRQRLREGWGAFINDGYGLTELFPLGGACLHSTALHITSDMAITEIVDPETGAPVAPGSPGEVVYTNIVGDSQPLLRFRTRDIARLATDAACACGFTGARLEGSIEGRVDDMIWFRGANIFPSAIERVVRGYAEFGNEFQIVVSGDVSRPDMTVRIEAGPALDTARRSAVAAEAQAALKAAIGVNATVELVEAGVLPRPDAKNKHKRVLDHRPR